MKKDKHDYVSVIYDEKRTPKTDYPKQLVNYLSKRFDLQGNLKLLELGCGRGDFLFEFQNIGFECKGLDREKSSVQNDYGLEVKQCDLTNEVFPYNDGSFDVVYHKSVLEHLYDPEHIMKETMRILKPGGKLIILTPDWHSQWKNFFEDFTHSRPYDVMALSDLLKVYGLNNHMADKFLQLPIVWKYPKIILFSKILQLVFNVQVGRWLAKLTGIKFFRWSVEIMIIGYGEKEFANE
jgi:SAM-dependent methyltransferase